MDSRELVTLLADGRVYTLVELAQQMDRTLPQLEACLASLPALGVKVLQAEGKVQLARPIELLDASLIGRFLSPTARQYLRQIHCEWVIDSTNQMALRGIAQERYHGHVYLSEMQTAGRGRRGRQWVSPFAGQVAMSIVWQLPPNTPDISALSLVVGVAVCHALQGLGIQGVGLKWPNDLLAQGKKLGGILLEMQGDPQQQCHIVMGIGLNVALQDTPLHSIDQPWIDLLSLQPNRAMSRNEVVASVLQSLFDWLVRFEEQGFAAIRPAWQALDVYAGAEVMVQRGEEYIFGTAAGVDDSGALCLDTSSGRQTFYGGEVSLRPKGTL
ncbi:MAG: hypothetical protein RL336_903 [Pseudomonadota bacterium]|jgi:BirA family biotin operon repressor/biotin-[acetyl-CoA-carboxylase] ligase